MSPSFWRHYARIYDTLRVFQGYQEMIGAIVEATLQGPVLDAACGTGNVTAQLADRGLSVVGLDSTPAMLERARQKCSTARSGQEVQFVLGDLDQPLPFEDASFAAITCSNALYCVGRPQDTLQEFRRLLIPGGRLVLSNPRPGFSMKGVIDDHWRRAGGGGRRRLLSKAFQLVWLIALNLLLLGKGGRRQFHFLEAEALLQLLEDAGFAPQKLSSCYANQGLLVVAEKS